MTAHAHAHAAAGPGRAAGAAAPALSADVARPPGVGPADRHGRLAPSAELLAAIEAAVELAWPRPASPRPSRSADPGASWRFSGRWWAAPLPLRRDRPRSSPA